MLRCLISAFAGIVATLFALSAPAAEPVSAQSTTSDKTTAAILSLAEVKARTDLWPKTVSVRKVIRLKNPQNPEERAEEIFPPSRVGFLGFVGDQIKLGAGDRVAVVDPGSTDLLAVVQAAYQEEEERKRPKPLASSASIDANKPATATNQTVLPLAPPVRQEGKKLVDIDFNRITKNNWSKKFPLARGVWDSHFHQITKEKDEKEYAMRISSKEGEAGTFQFLVGLPEATIPKKYRVRMQMRIINPGQGDAPWKIGPSLSCTFLRSQSGSGKRIITGELYFRVESKKQGWQILESECVTTGREDSVAISLAASTTSPEVASDAAIDVATIVIEDITPPQKP